MPLVGPHLLGERGSAPADCGVALVVGSGNADVIQDPRTFDWFRSTPGDAILGGLDLDHLLQRASVEPTASELSPEHHFLLMLNSIDMSDDECHGLGDRPLPLGFSAVGLRAMLGTASVEAALRVLARYYAVASGVFALEVRSGQGLTRIALRAEGRHRDRAAMLEEIWLMALYMFLTWFAGRRLPLLAMTVARPNHPDLGGAHWAFGAPLSNADLTSILVPTSCLQWARRAADVDEPIWEAMRCWLDETAPPVGEGLLGAAFVGAEAPARTRLREAFDGLALCDRQLSRRIRRETGVSFRDLRGEALVDLARDLLRNTDEAIDEIGARLGYAEERSFRRFMRSRTGLTPAQIRKGGALAPDPELRAKVRTMALKLQA